MAAIARVGFIGMGKMGWPMAARLVGAGFDVCVCDATAGRAEAFAAQVGGRAAATPAHAALDADAVITMLPSSVQVRDVVEAIGAALREGAILVEMSSGEPRVTRQIAEVLAPRGVRLVDAPVSGGVSRAETGDLAIMTGGDADDLHAAAPLLRAMGSSVTHVGGVGAGQAMKALNNLVSAGGFLIGIEALLIGQRFGLDPVLMVDVLNASTGMNNSTQRKFRQFVLSRRFDSGFSLDLMVKDLSTALGVGRETDTPTPFAALCRELWSAGRGALGEGQDHTAIARFSEGLAGVELGGGGHAP
jgi:3-hydroxyisobutyrate dehydrogenase